MNRLSSYVISVELKDTNKFMLVHGYTGAIDVLSKDITHYLKENKDSLSKSSFPFLDETWTNLVNRGYITSKSKDEEINYVIKFAELLHQQDKTFRTHFGFLVSYNCNFRCPYCYESKISDFGNNWSKNTLNIELVDKAYNAMNIIEPHKQFHSRTILLYGGEPLLKENKDIVKYIVDKGHELGYAFSTITNGYDLDYYLDLLSPEKICSVQITVDGCEATHNKKRVHKDGVATFNKIMDNIKLALDQNIHVSIRMNCNGENINEIPKLKKQFKDRGFYNYKSFYFYSALIVDYLKDYKIKDQRANSIEFMSRKDFIDNYANLSFHNFEDEGLIQRLTTAIKTGNKLLLNSIFCSAFSGSYIFDPHQNIYSCWESLGKKEAIVGNYKDDVTLYSNLKDWHTHNVGKSEKCSRCKYLFLCRGGCPVRNKDKKDLCTTMPKLFETSANKAYSKSMNPITDTI